MIAEAGWVFGNASCVVGNLCMAARLPEAQHRERDRRGTVTKMATTFGSPGRRVACQRPHGARRRVARERRRAQRGKRYEQRRPRHTPDATQHALTLPTRGMTPSLRCPRTPDFGDLPSICLNFPRCYRKWDVAGAGDARDRDLAMPDHDQLLTVTPPGQPDAAPRGGTYSVQTSSASHDAATASSQKRVRSKAGIASDRRHGPAEEAACSHGAPQPTITFEPTPARVSRAWCPRGRKLNLRRAHRFIVISRRAVFVHSSSTVHRGDPAMQTLPAPAHRDSEVREHAVIGRPASDTRSATNTHSVSPSVGLANCGRSSCRQK